ncbi:MAG: 2-C-methyl-D-erythritol 4-phosphate cytidylyltransferase [Candidatus Omnitrophica bacterium]|nr:2-C-methyl-D-erythritol 4-phosphate cytidylyltransferase [Candidatus Omnitrophota bacterium]
MGSARPRRARRANAHPRVAVIITAAGIGARFGGRRHKAFVPLHGRPMVAWSLLACEAAPAVADVVVTVHPADAPRARAVVRRYRCRKVRAIVRGGATRAESVARGLAAVPPAAAIVAVHDAARPLVTPALIARVAAAAARDGAALAAAPVAPTIKRVDARGRVVETLDRRRLWAAQTPQAFRRELLVAAYRRVRGRARGAATDEAMLLERCGVRSRIVEEGARNMKITTPDDLRMAAAVLSSPHPSPRRGEGTRVRGEG